MRLAEVLGLPAARVRATCDSIGGSFGLKSNPTREDVAVCGNSIGERRPIRIADIEWEDFAHCTQDRCVYEHAWAVGDSVFWINTQTMHQREAFPPTRCASSATSTSSATPTPARWPRSLPLANRGYTG